MNFLIYFFLSFKVFSLTLNPGATNSGLRCPLGQIMAFNGTTQVCVFSMRPTEIEPMIGGFCGTGNLTGMPSNPFMNFPTPLYRPNQPWWAVQGNYYYPNVHYPGPWSWPGIEARYYPGNGQVFAAKPNVYVKSIHPEKKFTFKFTSEEKLHFLATTPILPKDQTWKGKIVDSDKFEMEGTNYDYLFYDIRLPKEKMQFTNGICAPRENAILWMLRDLEEMKFPAIARQDFEEHWRVKIPDYPYYCIYPQYNTQLDTLLPVSIDIDQNVFLRSLYVLVPHQKEPDADDPQEIPFPIDDPANFRPKSLIKREIEFREWGVAFLGY
jgi:hypothetical protein